MKLKQISFVSVSFQCADSLTTTTTTTILYSDNSNLPWLIYIREHSLSLSLCVCIVDSQSVLPPTRHYWTYGGSSDDWLTGFRCIV